MIIGSIRHKGLDALINDDDTRGVSGDLVNRVRNVITALVLAPDVENILGPPG